MPRVLNRKRGEYSPDAVTITRPSVWGNPFRIGPDGSRDDVIDKYQQWLLGQPKLLERLHELKGKDLDCICTPKRCHGDVLIILANT